MIYCSQWNKKQVNGWLNREFDFEFISYLSFKKFSQRLKCFGLFLKEQTEFSLLIHYLQAIKHSDS